MGRRIVETVFSTISGMVPKIHARGRIYTKDRAYNFGI